MVPAIHASLGGIVVLIGIGIGRAADKAGDAAKATQARAILTIGAVMGVVVGAGALGRLRVAGEDWHGPLAGTHVRSRTRTDVNVGRVGARAC